MSRDVSSNDYRKLYSNWNRLPGNRIKTRFFIRQLAILQRPIAALDPSRLRLNFLEMRICLLCRSEPDTLGCAIYESRFQNPILGERGSSLALLREHLF